jgi:GAF domain-containing protein
MFPLPDLEQERLRILTSIGILDSGATAEFDAIVEHVRDLFGVPICLVSLVAEERQWFKANCGLEAVGTSREVSFCGHAILGTDVFVVEAASKDPRFSSNPLVTGEPHIRFYAGAPLVIRAGIALGSLCVIGREPRSITEPERLTLLRLSKVVTGLIRSHGVANQAVALAQQMEAQRFVMEAVDFHPEVTRDFHRELTRL